MPVRHASGAAADRLVVIGDAAVSRYCKNGIGSAYVTATLAARAALDHGVSADALRRHFWLPARRRIARDNFSGRWLASASDFILRSDLLSSVYLGACIRAPADRAAKTFHFVNWNMITGGRSYREMVRAAASPAFSLEMAKSAARLLARHLTLKARPAPDAIGAAPRRRDRGHRRRRAGRRFLRDRPQTLGGQTPDLP